MDSQKTEQVEKTSEFINGTDADKVIAKPSDVCCLKGTLHDGKPRGSTTTVAGVETYIVEPPKDKANGNILLYCELPCLIDESTSIADRLLFQQSRTFGASSTMVS